MPEPWKLTPEPEPATATFAASGDFMAELLSMMEAQVDEIRQRLARLEGNEE